jgi:hypothetical protein
MGAKYSITLLLKKKRLFPPKIVIMPLNPCRFALEELEVLGSYCKYLDIFVI